MFANCRLPSLTACAIALATLAASLNAQAEDWTYRADLGGWLDNETGLVWGPTTWNVSGSWTYDGALWGCGEYSRTSGIPGWRLPTLQEAQSAVSHNAGAYFEQTEGEPMHVPQWTSTPDRPKGKPRGHYVICLVDGDKRVLGCCAPFRVVRRP